MRAPCSVRVPRCNIVAPSMLRFRSPERAGFVVEHMHGDWSCGPLTAESRPIVTVARAAAR